MPQSLVKVLVHVVFSTKNRVDLISPEIEAELFSYSHGIIHNNKSKLIIVNGTANHIHLLISIGRTIDLSELIGDIKRASSLWMKQHRSDFYWQEGYGAFSIGQLQVEDVVRYIKNQKQHHAQNDFKDEFRALLEEFEVEYDERYVWD